MESAKVTRNPVPIHEEFRYSLNSEEMMGTAVATILKSRAVRSMPRFKLGDEVLVVVDKDCAVV